jgi:hypothetical protein
MGVCAAIISKGVLQRKILTAERGNAFYHKLTQ